jgi:hypothetical protein
LIDESGKFLGADGLREAEHAHGIAKVVHNSGYPSAE